ncbi:hypothetical protein Leryth_002447 [Lithospermum erythrorhizon]|nr:hypothetical protein Leryth_002447 [Lithospermum erythrorhizon]
MALEWVVLSYAALAEAILLLLLTLPGLTPLRKGLISVTQSILKPMLSVVPFCLFLLADIYWKFEHMPTCSSAGNCPPSDHLRHQKSVIKSQRNALLIVTALVFYWLLYSVTGLVVKIETLNKRVEKLKNQEYCSYKISYSHIDVYNAKNKLTMTIISKEEGIVLKISKVYNFDIQVYRAPTFLL